MKTTEKNQIGHIDYSPSGFFHKEFWTVTDEKGKNWVGGTMFPSFHLALIYSELIKLGQKLNKK